MLGEKIYSLRKNRKISQEEFYKKVVQLYEKGNSYLKISQMMNVDKDTVRKIIIINHKKSTSNRCFFFVRNSLG